jgi:tRNA modification GTPase
MYAQDTIVAPATPPGRGAVAIVRLSGKRAITIARRLWHPLSDSGRIGPRRLYLGEICDPSSGAVLDRAMCVIIPGPHSLTGEDIAEIHCHGGRYLVRRVVGLAAAEGARMAEPGEFSRRAFLNGRIDLTEAEAIADLVEARGEQALRNGIAQLTGALSVRVRSMRERLIAIRAHLEAEIDFSDEELDLPTREQIAADIQRLRDEVSLLHQSFARGRMMREGLRATIIGKPNAGKSSLLNLMLGSERAIVTPIPGTTRDVIEDSINAGICPLVLHDTAGIRQTDDAVERIGVARTLASAREADLVMAVFDSARPLDQDDDSVIELTRGRRGLALLNKSDLPRQVAARDLIGKGLAVPIFECSATTAAGLTELRSALASITEEMTGAPESDEVVISRERHRDALAHTLDALGSADEAIMAAMPPEIVAIDITQASQALGSITGEVSSEDVLDAIFREFCIGK